MSTLVGFLVIPLLSAAAPLLVIPAVARTGGADGWASVAIGLALGNAMAVIVDLGWSVVGPQMVASTPATAGAAYRESVASRVVVMTALSIPTVAAGLLIPSASPATVITTTLGVGLSGLSPSWLLIGAGRPWMLAAVETVPKAAACCAAAWAIALGGPPELYGVLLGVAALTTLGIVQVAGLAPAPRLTDFRRAGRSIRNRRVLAVGRAVSTTATVLPAALLGIVAPGLVAPYAAVDRPMRMGLQVLQAVPTRLQSWLGSAAAHETRRRARIVLGANTALGVGAAVVFSVLAPTVLDLLFDGSVDVDRGAIAAASVLIAVICTSRGLGLVAVARRRAGATSAAAVVIASTGALGLVLGAVLGGLPGAILGLVVAELLGLVPQALAIFRAGLVADSHRV
jgi:hypothetical protein